MLVRKENREDPDQTANIYMGEVGLHCLYKCSNFFRTSKCLTLNIKKAHAVLSVCENQVIKCNRCFLNQFSLLAENDLNFTTKYIKSPFLIIIKALTMGKYSAPFPFPKQCVHSY